MKPAAAQGFRDHSSKKRGRCSSRSQSPRGTESQCVTRLTASTPFLLIKKDSRHAALHVLLKAMKERNLSLTRASQLLFQSNDAYSEVKTEDVLDQMWEEGLCICLGHYSNYDYAITKFGQDVLRIL